VWQLLLSALPKSGQLVQASKSRRHGDDGNGLDEAFIVGANVLLLWVLSSVQEERRNGEHGKHGKSKF
jgi:hypothetical protein